MEIVECQEGYTSSGRFRQVTEKQAGFWCRQPKGIGDNVKVEMEKTEYRVVVAMMAIDITMTGLSHSRTQ